MGGEVVFDSVPGRVENEEVPLRVLDPSGAPATRLTAEAEDPANVAAVSADVEAEGNLKSGGVVVRAEEATGSWEGRVREREIDCDARIRFQPVAGRDAGVAVGNDVGILREERKSDERREREQVDGLHDISSMLIILAHRRWK